MEARGQIITDAETKHKQKLTGCIDCTKQNPYFQCDFPNPCDKRLWCVLVHGTFFKDYI